MIMTENETIDKNYALDDEVFECSECGATYDCDSYRKPNFKYCPHCGRKILPTAVEKVPGVYGYNINNYVYFKPTEIGKHIIKTSSSCSYTICEHGLIKMQLHVFMKIFSDYLAVPTLDVPFETTIYFEESHLMYGY